MIPVSEIAASMALLAERNMLREMGQGFRGKRAQVDGSDALMLLGIIAGVALFGWLLTRLLSAQERRHPYNSPRALFRGLCRVHKLKLGERFLLWKVARGERLSDPADVFVDPAWLDPQRLGPAWSADKTRLENLRRRLFAGLDDETAT